MLPPPSPTDTSKDASESRADVLLREALNVVEPLARLLVAHGVNYTTFAQSLKRVFLAAAEAELTANERKVSDSAISLLSGVHRKDVRALTRTAERNFAGEQALSTASMVFDRWVGNPAYRNADGTPRALPLRSTNADEPTFERLSQSVTKDFHARSVLDELIRLGLASEDDGWVKLNRTGFVPTKSFAEAAYFFGQNLRDHVASAAENLTQLGQGNATVLLEQAVFAEGLSSDSVQALHALTYRLWNDVRQATYTAAVERLAADDNLPESKREFRFRLGMYGFTDAPSPTSATRSVPEPEPVKESVEVGSRTP